MNPFLQRLQEGKVLVADGATGTNLQKMGAPAGMLPEELVLDNPQMILELETAFAQAGADILLTCTFGGTRLRMKESKYAGRVGQINAQAARLARKAAATDGKNRLVAGSIGPTGLLMKPYGPLTAEEAVDVFSEQVRGLLLGGVDLLVIETMFAFNEADAAFRAARSLSNLPVVVSFSYDRGVRTMMGVKPAETITRYKGMGAALVGANCGTSLENMEKVVQEYAAAEPGFPLWVKPNAGLPRLEAGRTIYDVTPEQGSAYALKFVALGARVVGGCCGNTPAHVQAIARAVKEQGGDVRL